MQATLKQREAQLADLQLACNELETQNAEITSRYERSAAEVRGKDSSLREEIARLQESKAEQERDHLAAMTTLRDQQQQVLMAQKERSAAIVRDLEQRLSERDEQLSSLRRRLADLEQQLARIRDSGVTSGSDRRDTPSQLTAGNHAAGNHRSYAAATTSGQQPGDSDAELNLPSPMHDPYNSSAAISRSSSQAGAERGGVGEQLGKRAEKGVLFQDGAALLKPLSSFFWNCVIDLTQSRHTPASAFQNLADLLSATATPSKRTPGKSDRKRAGLLLYFAPCLFLYPNHSLNFDFPNCSAGSRCWQAADAAGTDAKTAVTCDKLAQ